MLVTWSALKARHIVTAQCANGVVRNCRQMTEEYLRDSLERAFQTYGEISNKVTFFKYMGRVLTAGNN